MATIDQTIIQAKVTLQDIGPPIWRRLLLPPSLNLAELHHVLQAAFGWRDEHLHEFIIGGLVYGAPETAEDTASEDDPRTFEATDVHLRDFDVYHVPNPRFLYRYDFGDSWLHLIEFEQRLGKNTASKYPACVDGARHRPPEDVGGTSGYVQFLETWGDPAHEEYETMRQWAGRTFHPEKFDLQATDKAVKAAWRKARGDYLFRRQ
ncbi:MAG: plasmid pRiA4b ORF-3 family protein [Rhodospirillales bacterium]|nr:plasmid pRiA4b ORF-3 family protein [Rhodospirillales bacterium]